MFIKLSPQRREDTLEIIKDNDSLIVNGEVFDFSRIGEGDTLPESAISSEWFLNNVERINGELVFNIIFPIPWNYSNEQAFPKPLENLQNGLVEFPKPLSEEDANKRIEAEKQLWSLINE